MPDFRPAPGGNDVLAVTKAFLRAKLKALFIAAC
jgi:hypothetical protein